MAIESTSDIIGVAVLLAFGIVCIIILIWLNFIRKRRIKLHRARLIAQPTAETEDESYNIVASTRSISTVLKSKGMDTTDADNLIRSAEAELKKHNYKRAAALAERAKALLSAKNVKSFAESTPAKAVEVPMMKPDRTADILRGVDVFGDRSAEGVAVAEEKSDSFKLRTRLPHNLMQAKFEIKCAESAIQAAKEKHIDCKNAEELLAKAKQFFEAGDYTQSLSYALNSKRAAEGKEIVLEKTETIEKPEKAKVEVAKKRLCHACKTQVDDEDLFCRKCGTKLMPLACPNCKIAVDKEDVYCRKCGTKLIAEPEVRSFQCPLCQAVVAADATACPTCGAEFE